MTLTSKFDQLKKNNLGHTFHIKCAYILFKNYKFSYEYIINYQRNISSFVTK